MARSGLSSLSLSLSLSSLNWGPLLAFAELPICDLKGQDNDVPNTKEPGIGEIRYG